MFFIYFLFEFNMSFFNKNKTGKYMALIRLINFHKIKKETK